jgi:hypothetical protein
VSADNVAMARARIFLIDRLGMPGSFRAQARTPWHTVCSDRADVNYC